MKSSSAGARSTSSDISLNLLQDSAQSLPPSAAGGDDTSFIDTTSSSSSSINAEDETITDQSQKLVPNVAKGIKRISWGSTVPESHPDHKPSKEERNQLPRQEKRPPHPEPAPRKNVSPHPLLRNPQKMTTREQDDLMDLYDRTGGGARKESGQGRAAPLSVVETHDLTQLSHLDEQSLVALLRQRYDQGVIHVSNTYNTIKLKDIFYF